METNSSSYMSSTVTGAWIGAGEWTGRYVAELTSRVTVYRIFTVNRKALLNMQLRNPLTIYYANNAYYLLIKYSTSATNANCSNFLLFIYLLHINQIKNNSVTNLRTSSPRSKLCQKKDVLILFFNTVRKSVSYETNHKYIT